MSWDVEFTDEFEAWWTGLNESTQDSIDQAVRILDARGPHLGHPQTSRINGSKHGTMRELRVQHQGEPYRIFYAFDPRRTALLLLGGNKAGADRFYERMVPLVDKIFDDHLRQLEAKEKSKGS